MTPDQAERRRSELLAGVQAEDALLTKIVEALPDDKLTWKPDAENCRTAAEIAMHAAGTGMFFTMVVDGNADMGGEPPPAPTDKATLLAAINDAQNGFQARVSEYDPEQLAGETEFFGSTYNNIDILSWHRDHMIHHRAQVGLYLRLMGAKVPSTYGPSGDEDFAPAPAEAAGA